MAVSAAYARAIFLVSRLAPTFCLPPTSKILLSGGVCSVDWLPPAGYPAVEPLKSATGVMDYATGLISGSSKAKLASGSPRGSLLASCTLTPFKKKLAFHFCSLESLCSFECTDILALLVSLKTAQVTWASVWAIGRAAALIFRPKRGRPGACLQNLHDVECLASPALALTHRGAFSALQP